MGFWDQISEKENDYEKCKFVLDLIDVLHMGCMERIMEYMNGDYAKALIFTEFVKKLPYSRSYFHSNLYFLLERKEITDGIIINELWRFISQKEDITYDITKLDTINYN